MDKITKTEKKFYTKQSGNTFKKCLQRENHLFFRFNRPGINLLISPLNCGGFASRFFFSFHAKTESFTRPVDLKFQVDVLLSSP